MNEEEYLKMRPSVLIDHMSVWLGKETRSKDDDIMFRITFARDERWLKINRYHRWWYVRGPSLIPVPELARVRWV